MESNGGIPQAHIVRQAGKLIAPPRAPRAELDPDGESGVLRSALVYAVGLWPLTCVLLLLAGLLVFTAHLDAP